MNAEHYGRRGRRLAEARTALIVKPGSLGDVVHTLPAVHALKAVFPHLKIEWLVNTEWAPLLEDNPDLDRAILFPRREFRGVAGLAKAAAWARATLQRRQPDVCLDFQGLLRSALLAKAAKSKWIAGFAQAREGAAMFYDERVDVPDLKGTHAVDRYLLLARAVGADISGAFPGTGGAFPLPAGDPLPPELAKQLPAERFALIHPFSRGAGKSLSADEVEDLCRLAECPAVVVGSDAAPRLDLPDSALDLRGQTSLRHLIWLMRHSAAILSVDSGPLHLAAAITDRLVAVHSWSNPRVVGPYAPAAWVAREDVLIQVKDLAPDQFPERRGARKAIRRRGRLLSGAMLARLADKVRCLAEP